MAKRSEMMGSPVFIGGMMKSGTSLLRVLLGKHPNIFSSYETHWFDPEMQQDWRNSRSKRQIWLRELYEVPEEVFERLKRESNSANEFFDCFMTYCTLRAGKSRWVEKTPDNIRHLDRIWGHWPGALVIHVRRDLRDVYASWKKNRKRTLEQFLTIAQDTHFTLGDLLGSSTSNYHEVRYEQLVQHPRETMEAVLGFVGEPWAEDVESNDDGSREYERVKEVVGVESATAVSLKRPIFSDSVGQWQDLLTQEEANRIVQELGQFQPLLEDTMEVVV